MLVVRVRANQDPPMSALTPWMGFLQHQKVFRVAQAGSMHSACRHEASEECKVDQLIIVCKVMRGNCTHQSKCGLHAAEEKLALPLRA